MNDVLNRRVANYLGRLLVYFERPEIFDSLSLMKEASNLIMDLDDDRKNEVIEGDDFKWPPYEVPK